jgi:hypothetical protein
MSEAANDCRIDATISRDGRTFGVMIVPDCSGACYRAAIQPPGAASAGVLWSALPVAYDTVEEALVAATVAVVRVLAPPVPAAEARETTGVHG